MNDEIASIQFGVYSSQEILNYSACEVNNLKKKGSGSVYDPQMGVTEYGIECPTCKQSSAKCVGHPGYIKLSLPIIHPLFIKHVINILHCVCFKCYRCLLGKEHIEMYNLNFKKKFDTFVGLTELCKKKNHICCRNGCAGSDKLKERTYKIKHCPFDNNIYLYDKNDDGKETKTELTPYEIFLMLDSIPDDDVVNMGLNLQLCHPRNYIMFYLTILPPVDRPYINISGSIWDDDITIQYMDIIKINSQINKLLSSTDNCALKKQKITKLIAMLKFKISTTFNNTQGKSKHTTNGRPIKGIKERLAGKDGQIRNNMMGKRCNYSGRTVVGPDSTLRTNEIILPVEMANKLTVPIRVTHLNISILQDRLNNNKVTSVIKNNETKTCINIKRLTEGTTIFEGDVILRNDKQIYVADPTNVTLIDGDKILRDDVILNDIKIPGNTFQIEVGMVVNRLLEDGDWVLLNRQPTLHRGSMLAVKIIIRPYRTIRMNLSICKTFNADFDGDEMNIHVPQSEEAQAELQLLSSVEHHIISPQSSKPNIAIVQDSLLGSYKMSIGIQNIPRDIFFQIYMAMKLPSSDIIKRISELDDVYISKGLPKGTCYSGKGLISLCLPEDFNYEHRNNADPNEPVVKIYNGVLYQGAFDKSVLGSTHASILLLINKEYSPMIAMNFIDSIQFCATEWLLYRGFSVNFSDCMMVDKNQDVKTKEVIRKCYIEASAYKKTTTNPNVRELRIKSALNKAKDVGLRIAKDSLSKQNNFLSTVISGSKGDFFNISQITGLLGQQDILGQRVQYMMSNGRRSLCYYPINKDDLSHELEYESKGFISSSFIKGLNPKEFIFHAMSGREGITDTAMGTATSGYIQRKIVKLTEDINIQYDGTVRDHTGRIYQHIYGDNNLDPIKTTKVNGIQQFCNIYRIVEKLNNKYESLNIALTCQ